MVVNNSPCSDCLDCQGVTCMQPSPSEETASLEEFRQACLEHFGEVNVLIEEVVCCM